MTDPIERLHVAGEVHERRVIDSASADELSPEARARLSAAILGSAAVLGAAKLGAATAGKTAAKGLLAGSLKWGIIVGLTCGAAAAFHAVYSSTATAPPTSPSALIAPAVAASVDPIAATAEREPPALPVPAHPSEAPGSSSSGMRVASPPAAAPSASSVAEEIRRIDEARSALEQGDARSTIARLDEYAHEFPAGAFRQEADVLRVDAYVATGDRAGAARAADAFIRAHPGSPYAVRLRSLAREIDDGGAR